MAWMNSDTHFVGVHCHIDTMSDSQAAPSASGAASTGTESAAHNAAGTAANGTDASSSGSKHALDSTSADSSAAGDEPRKRKRRSGWDSGPAPDAPGTLYDCVHKRCVIVCH